jgi:ribosomal protein L37AE/L43A
MRYVDLDRHRRNYLQEALNHPLARHRDIQHRVLDMPTCQRCGALALRHQQPQMVLCPKCGHHGPAGPPLHLRMREVKI